MATVIGLVTSVRQLEPRGDKKAIMSVSIEGLSFLVPEKVKKERLPNEGDNVRLQVSTFWPRGGGRPIFWYNGHEVVG